MKNMFAYKDDEKLIRAVKRRAFLYDVDHPQHNHRSLVLNAWKEIAEEVGQGYEVHAVKDRWTSIRDYYRRKIRENAKIRSGELTKKLKKWCLFDKLHFLKRHLRLDRTQQSQSEMNIYMHHSGSKNDSDADKDSEEEGISIGIVKMEDTDEEDDDVISNDSYRRDVVQALDSSFKPEQTSDKLSRGRVRNPGKRRAQQLQQYFLDGYNAGQAVKRQLLEGSNQTDKHVHGKTSPVVALEETQGKINSNKHFFTSLIPMVETLDSLTAMEFRHEVHGVLLRYLKQAQNKSDAQTRQEAMGRTSATANSSDHGDANNAFDITVTAVAEDKRNGEVTAEDCSAVGDALS